MKIFYAPKTEQVPFEQMGIEASFENYVKLAAIVKSGGRMEADIASSAAPYGELLRFVEVGICPRQKVDVQVRDAALFIEGDAEHLLVLSENIAEFGEDDEGRKLDHHQHIECLGEDYYLSENAVPFVLYYERE